MKATVACDQVMLSLKRIILHGSKSATLAGAIVAVYPTPWLRQSAHLPARHRFALATFSDRRVALIHCRIARAVESDQTVRRSKALCMAVTSVHLLPRSSSSVAVRVLMRRGSTVEQLLPVLGHGMLG